MFKYHISAILHWRRVSSSFQANQFQLNGLIECKIKFQMNLAGVVVRVPEPLLSQQINIAQINHKKFIL